MHTHHQSRVQPLARIAIEGTAMDPREVDSGSLARSSASTGRSHALALTLAGVVLGMLALAASGCEPSSNEPDASAMTPQDGCSVENDAGDDPAEMDGSLEPLDGGSEPPQDGGDASTEASTNPSDPPSCEDVAVGLTTTPECVALDGATLSGLSVGPTAREVLRGFILSESATVTVTTLDATDVVTTALFAWGKGPVDVAAPLVSALARPDSDATFRINLPRGRYLVSTVPYANTTATFGLSILSTPYAVAEPAIDPGGDKTSAEDLGELGTDVAKRGGYVGPLDTEDYFGFELANSATVKLDLLDPDEAVTIQLFSDSPVIDENDALATQTTRTNINITMNLPQGRYFVRVSRYASEHAFYTVTAFATSYQHAATAPDPGGDKGSAYDLGSITAQPASSAGYVGPLDAEDYFKFVVSAPGPVTLDLVDPLNAVTVGLYRDAPVIDEASPLTSFSVRTNRTLTENLEAGVYYLRVSQYSGEHALYSLSVRAGGP